MGTHRDTGVGAAWGPTLGSMRGSLCMHLALKYHRKEGSVRGLTGCTQHGGVMSGRGRCGDSPHASHCVGVMGEGGYLCRLVVAHS